MRRGVLCDSPMPRRRSTADRRAAAPQGGSRIVDKVLGPQPADLQALIDSIPALIWYKDSHNRVLRLNVLAAKSMGKTVEELEGRSTFDLYPGEAAQYHQDDLEVIRSGEPKLGIVEPFTNASGERLWMRTDKIPYRNETGDVVGVIVVAVDVTERVRTDEALRRTQEELERRVDERTRQLAAAVQILNAETAERRRAEARVHEQQAELAHVLRLHTLEGLAANLAHEINQPLAAIVNFARGLERRLAAPAPDLAAARQVAGRIGGEALRAAEVVRRLRASVRKDAPNRQRCDLGALLRAAASLIATEASRADVALRFDLDPELPKIQVDRVQIEQVVLNLLQNAVDAVRGGGPAPHVVRVEAAATAGGGAEVRVCDDGPGLPPGGLAQLLEPFFTTKAEGLGMGLSISQRIVEAHGGALRAWTNPEGGATFAFTLPGRLGAVIGAAPEAPVRPPDKHGRRRARSRPGAA